MSGLNFNRVFNHNKEKLGDNFSLTRQDIGSLNLKTGEIIANDPLTLFEDDTFLETVELGEYPVSVFVLNLHQNGDKRVALAAIYFSDKEAKSWKMATIDPDQDVLSLGEDQIFGYGVDSGLGGFMDKAAMVYLTDLELDSPKAYEKLIFDDIPLKLNEDYVDTYNAIIYKLDEKENINMALFSSGFGDGAYASYYGYDENDKVCCLVTDFNILDNLEELEEFIENSKD